MQTFFDLVKYIKLFQVYLGKRIYLIFFLSLLASISEGLGILMLLPLLNTLGSDGLNGDPADPLTQYILDSLEFFGFEISQTLIISTIVILFAFKGLITFVSLAINANLIGSLLRKVKTNLYDHYSEMKYGYYSKKDTGYFINLINEQPTKALEAFNQLTTFTGHLANATVLISLAFIATWEFGIFASIVGIILLGIFMLLNNFVRSLSRKTANENGILSKWLIQALQGFKYLLATSQAKVLRAQIIQSISKLTDYQIKTGYAAAFTQSVREPIAVFFIMLVVIMQTLYFQRPIEPILVSVVLFYRALNAVLAVQSGFQGTFQHIGSMELVDKEFQNQRLNHEESGKIEVDKFEESIKFKNIKFSYDKQLILNNLNLEFKFNQTTAILGESGSGKSTILNLLTMLYDPDDGEILLDGNAYKSISKNSFRKKIGYVSQETVVFDDTIANNISMWGHSENDLAAVIDAAKKANLYDYIVSLDDSFQTRVGDRGMLLSGGQRQRLFIARELYRNPEILILDEATSALDSESESKIQESIENLNGKVTVILISHRLSTIKNSDNILILQDGNLLETGKFNEIIKNESSVLNKLIKLQNLN